MTVAKLIEKLKLMPQDAIVKTYDEIGGNYNEAKYCGVYDADVIIDNCDPDEA